MEDEVIGRPNIDLPGALPGTQPTAIQEQVGGIDPNKLGGDLASIISGGQKLVGASVATLTGQQPVLNQQQNNQQVSLPSNPNLNLPGSLNGTGLTPGKVTPEESKDLLPQIEQEIRAKEDSRKNELSYYDLNALNSIAFGSVGDKRAQTTRFNVAPESVYTTLGDGTNIATVSNYINGTDNQSRLASEQSSISKIGNGLLRFGGKTLVNVAGGTVGIVAGIVSAMDEGRFSAVYDNSFGRYLDDLNTRLDYNLPIYKSQDEQEMGFFKRLGTTSFWADEFLNGLSFLSGALLTEGAWATVTGGASLPSSAARLAGRIGLRTGGQAAGRRALIEGANALNGLQRATTASKALNAANTLRFTMTSAGYESSVEARHSFKEAMEDYIAGFQNAYGRDPGEDEISEFTTRALQNSNFVFGANMAIVGSSNLFQLGSYFGIGTGLGDRVSASAGKRVFGRRVVESIAENGTKTLKVVRGNVVQRGLETSFNLLKRPFVEGVYEEGLQGAVNEASKSWLNSRFNPEATEYNISLIRAFLDGLHESYGTREGQLEIGVGALIGLVGSAGQRGADGRNILLGARESSSLINYLNQEVSNRNKYNEGLSKSLENTLLRLHRLNQMTTAFANADNASGAITRQINLDTANFTQMLMQDEIGYLPDAEKNFLQILNDITPEAIRSMDETVGDLSDSQLNEYKEAIRTKYQQDISDYRNALEIAQAIDPTAQYTSEGQIRNFTAALALNIYQGRKAYQNLTSLAEEIDNTLGKGQAGDIMAAWDLVSEDRRELTLQLSTLQGIQEEYQTRLADITQNLQLVLTDGNISEEGSTQRVSEADKLRRQQAELSRDLVAVQNQITQLNEQINTATEVDSVFYEQYLGLNTKNLSVDELLQMSQYNEEIRDTVNAMRRNPNISDNIVEQADRLLRDFTSSSHALKSFINTVNRMSDPRFLESPSSGSIFGSANLIRAGVSNIARTDYKGQEFSEEVQRTLDGLNMSDDAKFTLGTLLEAFNSVEDIESQAQQSLNNREAFYNNLRDVEPITDELWNNETTDEVIEGAFDNIINKKLNNIPLSPRETAIFNTTGELRRRFKQARLEQGQRVQPEIPENETKTQRLRRQIDEAIENSPTLQAENNRNELPSKPTSEEIDEYLKLLNEIEKPAYRKPTLTERQQQNVDRFHDLADKIRTYSNFVGVSIGDGINLIDALGLLQQFESNQTGAQTAVITQVDTTNMLNDIPQLNSENRNEKNLFAQVWDKVTMSFVSQVETLPFKTVQNGVIIQGLTFQGLMGYFNNVTRITRVETGDSLTDVNLEEGFTTNPMENYIVEFEDGQKIDVHIDSRNNPLFDLSQQSIIESNSNLLLTYLGDVSSAYKVLLNKDLIPIDSDYQLESGKEIDIQAVKELTPDSRLSAEVDTDNPYNRRLIQDYNNSNKSQDDLNKLSHNLVIEIYDSSHRLVGIFKAAHNDAAGTNSYNELISIRNGVVNKIIGESPIVTQQPIGVDTQVRNEAIRRIESIDAFLDEVSPIGLVDLLFTRNSRNRFISLLFPELLEIAESLNVTIQFSTTIDGEVLGRPGYFNSQTGSIVIQLPYFFQAYDALNSENKGSELEFLRQTIIHEMLHSVTAKAYTELASNLTNGQYTGTILTQPQAEALIALNNIYKYVSTEMSNRFVQNTYGLTSIYEFLAELGDVNFITSLQGIELPSELRYEPSGQSNIIQDIINYIKEFIYGNSRTADESVFNALQDVLMPNENLAFQTPQVINPSGQTTSPQTTETPSLISGIIGVDTQIAVDDTLPGRPNLNISEGNINFVPLDSQARDKVVDVGYLYNGKIRLKGSTSDVNIYPFSSHIVNNKGGIYSNQFVPVVVLEAGGKLYAYPARYQTMTVDVSSQLLQIASSTTLSDAEKLLRLNTILADNGISFDKFGFTPADLNDDAFLEIVTALEEIEIAENISSVVRNDEVSKEEILTKVSLDINLNESPFHSPKFKVRPITTQTNTTTQEGLNLPYKSLTDLQSQLNKPC